MGLVMTLLALPFPAIDPVALSIGPLELHWYALAYLAGFIVGWQYAMRLADRGPDRPNRQDMDAFLTWAIIAVILGGRLGFVLFYNVAYYIENPVEILFTWQGGMSFHGGLLGVITAVFAFSAARKIDPLAVGDIIAVVAPIGIFLGRIANFVNGELYGRVTDAPWGVIFPAGGPEPRHPSQLYEAVAEGLILFIILFVLARRQRIRQRPGVLAGVFLVGYGLGRFLVEFVREPDPQLGFLWLGATMGQLLCLPMILGGAALTVWAWRRGPQATAA